MSEIAKVSFEAFMPLNITHIESRRLNFPDDYYNL